MLSFISMPGGIEWIVIAIFGLLIFGNRLPSVAKSIGSTFVEFKRGLIGVEEDLKEIDSEIKKKELK